MRKITVFLCLFLAVFSVILTNLVAGGEASDPLVTVSFARELYIASTQKKAEARASELVTQKGQKLQTTIDARISQRLAEQISGSLAQSLQQSGALSGSRAWRDVTLAQGDVVSGPVGAGIMLTTGSAATTGTSELIDVTNGRALAVGVTASPHTYYMVSLQQSAGLRVTSAQATVRLKDGATVTRAVVSLYEDEANRLNTIGLFRGSNHGYELARRPTRQEALIMLIRLLGEEDKALAHTGKASFTDLAGWPDGIKYVAYGEHMKYTNGISTTQFAQQTSAESNVYFTYVLRALGYSDANGDFSFRAAMDKAIEVGLITSAQYEQLKETGMLRDHMALISYNALWVKCKGTTQTLGERLVEYGVLTNAQLSGAKK